MNKKSLFLSVVLIVTIFVSFLKIEPVYRANKLVGKCLIDYQSVSVFRIDGYSLEAFEISGVYYLSVFYSGKEAQVQVEQKMLENFVKKEDLDIMSCEEMGFIE